jgi:hypothetical protein
MCFYNPTNIYINRYIVVSKLTKKFDFWIQNNLNVLLVGNHGIGKTELVTQAFNRHNINWQYFSGATMDPWVDFIGVPKEKVDEHGKSYLDLVLPKTFAEDKVEAIFMDELNRSPSKVRNAIMELVQFKTINGRKFKNLRFVWAAINPYDEDETYDVDRLDPAQEDRFHIHFQLPETPSEPYFTDKYGSIGVKAVSWWETIPLEHRHLISPRRLDYAVDIYLKGGDLTDVLNAKLRPDSLKKYIERIDQSNESMTDLWLADPEQYINQLTSRTDKTDIVAAFVSLKEISMDQAVAFIPKLSASKLKKLVHSPDTIDLILKSTISTKTSTALKTIAVSDNTHLISHGISESSRIGHVLTDHLTNLNADPNKTKNWKLLLAAMDVMELSLIQKCCVMAICTNKIQSSFENPRSRGRLHHRGNSPVKECILKIIQHLILYVTDPGDLFHLVTVHPTVIHAVLQ